MLLGFWKNGNWKPLPGSFTLVSFVTAWLCCGVPFRLIWSVMAATVCVTFGVTPLRLVAVRGSVVPRSKLPRSMKIVGPPVGMLAMNSATSTIALTALMNFTAVPKPSPSRAAISRSETF